DGTALPDWLAFSNGHLIGTPPADAADDYSIRVTASDGEVGTDPDYDVLVFSATLAMGLRFRTGWPFPTVI
ncbi:hypothetical protein CQA15_29290, partial [Klebsiella pneumoniae]|uniref:putative Ig domain-containing protein n=1 Tax=Klebsiella pneumoniae TaxID=573 RepID=UPI000BC3C81B